MPTDPIAEAEARRDHRLRCAAGDLAAGGTLIRADKALAFAQDIDTLLAERDHLRQVAEDAEVRLMSMNARLAINPTECVQMLREELEDEIRDEMSGGPPGRKTRWPDLLDALLDAALRTERPRE